MTPFIETNDILADDDALRSRADREGYLFLRRLVDREPILKVRRDIASTLQDAGWIDAGRDPSEANTCHPARIAGTDEHKPVYDRVQKLKSFHSLAHNYALFRIARVLLCPDVLLHPSNIARFIFPNSLDYTTPAHQDFILIQGSPNVWTAGIPLDDCPYDLGGLSLLIGSHKVGVLPVSRALGHGEPAHGHRECRSRMDFELFRPRRCAVLPQPYRAPWFAQPLRRPTAAVRRFSLPTSLRSGDGQDARTAPVPSFMGGRLRGMEIG